MWTIWQEANTRQAHWFRYNGRKWDGELFNVEWWGGGRVNGGNLSNRSTVRPSQPGLGQLFTGASWSFGGFGFWLLIMFGPLTVCFIISYIVHLVHVMKLVRMRQQGLDDDFEGKTYSRASAMLSMRGLERQNTTFLHVRPEDEFEDHKHPWTNY